MAPDTRACAPAPGWGGPTTVARAKWGGPAPVRAAPMHPPTHGKPCERGTTGAPEHLCLPLTRGSRRLRHAPHGLGPGEPRASEVGRSSESKRQEGHAAPVDLVVRAPVPRLGVVADLVMLVPGPAQGAAGLAEHRCRGLLGREGRRAWLGEWARGERSTQACDGRPPAPIDPPTRRPPPVARTRLVHTSEGRPFLHLQVVHADVVRTPGNGLRQGPRPRRLAQPRQSRHQVQRPRPHSRVAHILQSSAWEEHV